MRKEQVPFSQFDNTLKEIIEKKYIYPVTEWLLTEVGNNVVLAQSNNSLWESALTIIFLERLKKLDILGNHKEELIDEKIKNVANWLVNEKNIYVEDGIEYINWENVTWDTAVIIRAILLSSLNAHSKKKEYEELSYKSMVFLYEKFLDWDKTVKYPFGAADLAQIVSTSVFIFNNFPELSQRITDKIIKSDRFKKRFKKSKDLLDLSLEIIKYLLFIKEQKIENINEKGNEIGIYWWDDYFTTSEVLDCLSIFYSTCNQNSDTRYKKNLKDIMYAITGACLYFENNQFDGMWGSHIDTIRVIDSYVNISSLKKLSSNDLLIEPEIHTAFKAIRWICDEKQVFSDGSFMHTMFLTIFYANALLTIHEKWDPANKKIYDLYDDVVWSAPVRTTPERNMRLFIEMENNRMDEEIVIKNEKIKDLYAIGITIFALFVMVYILDLMYDFVSVEKSLVKIDFTKIPKFAYATGATLVASFVAFIKKYSLK